MSILNFYYFSPPRFGMDERKKLSGKLIYYLSKNFCITLIDLYQDQRKLLQFFFHLFLKLSNSTRDFNKQHAKNICFNKKFQMYSHQKFKGKRPS